MSQTPVTVTYSLEEVLGEIKQSIKEVSQKLDNLQKDVTDLKVGQARLEEKVESINQRLGSVEKEQKTLANDVADLKGIKSLIIPIIVAVITSLLTLLIRVIPNP